MSEVVYKEFRVDAFFKVEGTKSLDKGKLTFVSDGINFIGRVAENNGIQGQIQKQFFEPNEANTITCTVIGTKVAKLQKEPYYCSQNINKLTPLFTVDETIFDRVCYYFITLIQKFLDTYNGKWDGYKLDDLKSYMLHVPVTSYGEADYNYMATYISELEQEHISELEQYLAVTGLDNYELTEEDLDVLQVCKESMEFKIGDLFEKLKAPYLGKGTKAQNVSKEKTQEFCVPVVYAKSGNNGIMYWAKKGDFTTFSNVISIVYNGAIAAGLVYAQEEPTGILAESYMIKVKNKDVSHRTNLYLKTAIQKVIYPLYSREHLATWDNKVEKDIITLPVTQTGEPDYEYMDKYIRVQEKLAIKGVVEYKDRVIEETKKVVL